MHFQDSQAAMGFVRSQLTFVEPRVYSQILPDILYPGLVPVDRSAPEWIKTITYVGLTHAGEAKWINGNTGDVPNADFAHEQFETRVEAEGIGYSLSLEEINQSRLLGLNLGEEKARSARRANEEFIDQKVIFTGDATKGFNGLYNYPGVPVAAATNGNWPAATADQIVQDVNDAIQLIDTNTNNTRMADTVLLSPARFNRLATLRVTDTSETALQFLLRNNIYTATTGQPLTIRAARNLDTAGAGGVQRMIAYVRDIDVLKVHIPMTFGFLPPHQRNAFMIDVAGMGRIGGLDIRYPQQVVYVDGI